MDADGGCESINELSSSSSCKEVVECPLHSDIALNGVSGHDSDVAVRRDVEFKDVLNSDVSVLTALLLFNRAVSFQDITPLVELNVLAVFK